MMLKLPDVKVTEAVSVPAATTGAIQAAHCRVNGVIGTEIKFSLLLPDQWNGKFFMGGGGGFVGSVQNSSAATVNAGYATVGTDTGHQGGRHRRELGAQQPRAQGQLRLSGDSSHGGDREGDHRGLLRIVRDEELLRRVLARRRPGVHGGTALPRRFRRHRRRRARVQLDGDCGADGAQHAGGVS